MDTRFIPVDTRFIPVNIRWTPGSSRSTHSSLRLIMVHYGALRFITGIVTIPVNTRFITVHPGQHSVLPGQHQVWIFSTVWCRFDQIIKHVSSFKICSRSTQGYSRFVPVGHGSSQFIPVDTLFIPVPPGWWTGGRTGMNRDGGTVA